MKPLLAALAAAVLLVLGGVAQPASATADASAPASETAATVLVADTVPTTPVADEVIPGDPYADDATARATLAECKFWFIHNKPLYRKYCL